MKLILSLALLVNLGAPTAYAGTEIPVVSLDERGNAVEEKVSVAAYQENLEAILGGFEESATGALASTEASQGGKWKLRTIAIGIAARCEVGVGPLKVAGLPKVRLGFTRGKNPPIP